MNHNLHICDCRMNTILCRLAIRNGDSRSRYSIYFALHIASILSTSNCRYYSNSGSSSSYSSFRDTICISPKTASTRVLCSRSMCRSRRACHTLQNLYPQTIPTIATTTMIKNPRNGLLDINEDDEDEELEVGLYPLDEVGVGAHPGDSVSQDVGFGGNVQLESGAIVSGPLVVGENRSLPPPPVGESTGENSAAAPPLSVGAIVDNDDGDGAGDIVATVSPPPLSGTCVAFSSCRNRSSDSHCRILDGS
jgi:hypothetical protein